MIKVESNNNWTKDKQDEHDAKMVQMRKESYNREIRERHMKTFRKRQEKKELLKRQKAS